MLNWLLATYNATGFVYDPRTGDHARLSQHYHYRPTNLNFLEPGPEFTGIPRIHLQPAFTIQFLFPSPWYQQLSSKLAAVVLKTSFLFSPQHSRLILRSVKHKGMGFCPATATHVRSRRPVMSLCTLPRVWSLYHHGRYDLLLD
jgi:hypothetical protein